MSFMIHVYNLIYIFDVLRCYEFIRKLYFMYLLLKYYFIKFQEPKVSNLKILETHTRRALQRTQDVPFA